MQIVSAKSLVATLLLFAGIAAHANPVTTITFEEHAGVSYSGVPNGTGGLNYQNFALLDTNDNSAFDGFSASGVEVIYDSSGQTSSFSSPETLTLYSFYIDATDDGQPVAITGYDAHGNLIDTLNLNVAADNEALETLNWTGLASVTFTPGGDDSGYFSLDDVTISQAPEPSSLALLGTGLIGALGATRRTFKT